MPSSSRRSFLETLTFALPGGALGARVVGLAAFDGRVVEADRPAVPMLFPTQPPELVEEMVVVAHGNVARVRALVERQPTLAKATWDWGFGDWETALGAASHVGNREIAEVLLAHGAHPTIFSAAMRGELEVVKAFVAASPAVVRTRGPHSISLLSHAKAGGSHARSVYDYLQTVEGADDHPAVQPLSEAEAAAVTGSYPFGVTPADRMEITVDGAQVQIGRPGHYARGLFHLGGLVFCPMGAESVRIAFDVSSGTTVLTIHDPDVVLTAKKGAAGTPAESSPVCCAGRPESRRGQRSGRPGH
jgi:hypothetical protein